MKALRRLAIAACVAAAGCGGTDGSSGSVQSAGGNGDGGNGGENGDVLLCPCKVTGGGFVFLDGERVTFGFNAQPESKNDPELVDGAFAAKGQLEIQFHDQEVNLHGGVETIACFVEEGEPVLVEFGGTLRDDGPFTVQVVDLGEPGVDDTIAFEGGGQEFGALDLGGDGPGGGNIQLHKIDLSQCVGEEPPKPPKY